jgi:circadian clock protein KaiC
LPPTNKTHASTGIAGLDDVLAGGFPRNHLYLVEGHPGTGKTTLALQFLLGGQRDGEKGLYVTLSESKDEILEVGASHGWKLDSLPIFEMTPTEEELSPEQQYTVFHPSDVELNDTTKMVLDQVGRIDPTRVVFDSLSELRLLARDPLRYRRQILALKRFFAGRKCTVLLLDDLTAAPGDLQVESIAHGVLAMERLEREYGINRRRLEIRKLRGARYREGYHDFSIESGGIVVHPRLIAAEHRPDMDQEPVSSGLKELDALLGGGIDSGTSTLLMGPAGSGKSTIAIHYAIAAARRGHLACVFCFDESAATLAKRAKGLGTALDEHLESGKLVVQQIEPAELAPGAFVSRIRDLVQHHNAKVIVIDSLNGLLNAMPDERFLIIQLHELLSFLGQQGVATIMTLAQQGMIGDGVASPLDLSYVADSVVLFRYFESEGQVKQALSVMKKRSGPHERSVRELSFSRQGVQVGPPLEKFVGVLTGVPTLRG